MLLLTRIAEINDDVLAPNTLFDSVELLGCGVEDDRKCCSRAARIASCKLCSSC